MQHNHYTCEMDVMTRCATDPQHSGRRLVVASDRAGNELHKHKFLLVSTIKGMNGYCTLLESAKCMIWRDDNPARSMRAIPS